jgi:L,D-transpeptidase ErfK/SrfK
VALRRRALLAGALAAPLAASRVALAATQRPDGDMVGASARIVAAERTTLADVALAHGLGYVELVAANPGVDPWLPRAGAEVLLPSAHLLPSTPRAGIVVNYADQRLYLVRPDGRVQSHPVGIPAEGVAARQGVAHVVARLRHPAWAPTPAMRARAPDLPAYVPPGPDNPLGSLALALDWPGYLIHGTNRPYGIGRRVSEGCIRLHEADIAALAAVAGPGTPVRFVEEEVKLGWSRGTLHLEVHPTLDQALELQESRVPAPEMPPRLAERVARAAGMRARDIDWSVVAQEAVARSGVPVPLFR